MAEHTIDIPTFRLLFPAFADDVKFPDAYINAQWSMAGSYILATDNCLVSGDKLQNALNLMTAHLLQLNVALKAAGPTPSVGVMQSATIDKVSVTMAPPPFGSSAWKYWLSTTPYGLQLLALLRAIMGAGVYVGGLPERSGFRKVGGIF